MVRELRTREDYYDALMSGEGLIVITDVATHTKAHPLSCPSVDAAFFMEKVVQNEGKNGAYFWASSLAEARRELDAAPCNCS